MTNTIVVPLDGSETGFKALDVAAKLADKHLDKVIVLNVVRTHHPPQELQRYFETEYDETPTEWEYDRMIASGVLEDGKRRAERYGLQKVETRVEIGSPVRKIIDVAKKEKANMIVMGNRGLGAVKGLAFGSVSQKVSHIADCTVVTVS